MNTTHDELRRIGRRLTGQEDELAKVQEVQLGIVELRDGVTLHWLKTNAPWVLGAVIEDAFIGRRGSYLVWYDGIWKFGTWENGVWRSGTWEYGIWKYGIWEGGIWRGGYDAHHNYHDNPPSEW